MLGHCAFVFPFHPYKLHRDAGCLSKYGMNNGLGATLCHASPATAPGLGRSCNSASHDPVLWPPGQTYAPSACPKNLRRSIEDVKLIKKKIFYVFIYLFFIITC